MRRAWLGLLLVCGCSNEATVQGGDTPNDASVEDVVAVVDSVVSDTAVEMDTMEPDVATPPPPPPGPKGFWRIENSGARTWLMSPSGAKVFGLGVNTVMRDKQCDGMTAYIKRGAPSLIANTEWARLSTGNSGGVTVDKPYCFNSVGAFSDSNDFDSGGDSWMIRPSSAGGAGAPYGVVLNVSPGGSDRALRDEKGVVLESGVSGTDIGDPFNPAFAADLDKMIAADVVPRKDDPALQMWFSGNEIGIFDVAAKDKGVRDFRRYIWTTCPAGSTIDAPRCAPHVLASLLRTKYETIAKLNAAWESAYADFNAVVASSKRPVPYVHDCNYTCRTDLQVFVHDWLIRGWVKLVTMKIRAADPNHIISSPRLAISSSANYNFWTPGKEVWVEDGATLVGTDTTTVKYTLLDLLARDGAAGFDVVSLNAYTGDARFETPWFTDGVHRIQSRSGLPIYISEFGIRARIDGWSNKGGAGSFVPSSDSTPDQIQRGAYYRSQIEQFISFRGIIGASWHAWSDRYLASDPAHQINMGLMKCAAPGMSAGARWDEVDDRVSAINCGIMKAIEGATGL